MNKHSDFRLRSRNFKAVILTVLCAAFLAGPLAVADMTLKHLPREPFRPTSPQLSPEVQKDITKKKPFDGRIVRFMSAWPGPPWVEDKPMKIHVVIEGTCPKLFVDWGDGNIDTYTNTGTWQFPHTYQKAGIMAVRVWGQGCMGEIKSQYVIHQSAPNHAKPAVPGFSSCPSAGVTRLTGMYGSAINVLSMYSDEVLVIGCGFGDKPGTVELLGRQLGNKLSQTFPFPKRLEAKVYQWTPNSIYLQIPQPATAVVDQKIDILVSPSESSAPLPKFEIPWQAKRDMHSLSFDEVKMHCGLKTDECPFHPGVISASHGCAPEGTVRKSFDTVEIGPLENGWVTKSVHLTAFEHGGAVSVSGFQPGQTKTTVRVDYTLPQLEGGGCRVLIYKLDVVIEGTAGIPYRYTSIKAKAPLHAP